MPQYTKGRRRPQDHFDGGVIVTEQQQGTNVLIRYPEVKSKMNRIQRKWEVFPGMCKKVKEGLGFFPTQSPNYSCIVVVV